jgi:hypothetical protein
VLGAPGGGDGVRVVGARQLLGGGAVGQGGLVEVADRGQPRLGLVGGDVEPRGEVGGLLLEAGRRSKTGSTVATGRTEGRSGIGVRAPRRAPRWRGASWSTSPSPTAASGVSPATRSSWCRRSAVAAVWPSRAGSAMALRSASTSRASSALAVRCSAAVAAASALTTCWTKMPPPSATRAIAAPIDETASAGAGTVVVGAGGRVGRGTVLVRARGRAWVRGGRHGYLPWGRERCEGGARAPAGSRGCGGEEDTTVRSAPARQVPTTTVRPQGTVRSRPDGGGPGRRTPPRRRRAARGTRDAGAAGGPAATPSPAAELRPRGRCRLDLAAAEDVHLAAGARAAVPTGLRSPSRTGGSGWSTRDPASRAGTG